MSAETKIEWTDATLSPWIGCSPVSAGCAHCYLPTTTPARVHGVKLGGPRLRVKTFRGQALALNRKAERLGRRLRVFPSLCDWLDAEVPTEWLADFLDVVRLTPALDWQLLTKRPALFRDRLAEVLAYVQSTFSSTDTEQAGWALDWLDGRAPANAWIGTSIEHQRAADERVPALLTIPAAVRFVSLEPLLEPVDFAMGLPSRGVRKTAAGVVQFPVPGVDWGIVGGESGPEARPCNVEWVHSLVVQFAAAGVPLFVKQLGRRPFHGPIAMQLRHPKGGDPAEWPACLNVRQMPEVRHA